MIRSDLTSTGHRVCDTSSFSREHSKRKKHDASLNVGLPLLQSVGSDNVTPEALIASIGNANHDEDLVDVLLSAPSMTVEDDFMLERELSRCLSQPWMFADDDTTEAVIMPRNDKPRTGREIMKKVRSIGNFVLVSEDPKDMETPFLLSMPYVDDGKEQMTRSPSSDESTDGHFTQETREIGPQASKHFKLACLAGYLKSLVEATYSSRHVASGVPCITPKSIEECLIPRSYAADDLVQCFFDGDKITGTVSLD